MIPNFKTFIKSEAGTSKYTTYLGPDLAESDWKKMESYIKDLDIDYCFHTEKKSNGKYVPYAVELNLSALSIWWKNYFKENLTVESK